MKLSCEKYVLQNAVSVALRAAASKSPITALEGLLLEASVDLKITGYDLKEGIYTLMAADVEEPGSIVVSAKLFSEMIRRMPDGIVTISTDENLNINVRCGKSDFHFMGISAEEYPEMPDVNGQSHVTLPQKILRSMITQTLFAVATSDARPIYTGTLFEINGSELTLVSVDGYRLAKRTEHIENGQMENGSFVVPGSALSDVERICGDDEEATVQIAVGLKHISFGIGDTVVITRRLEGDFLNYRKSIPENFRYQIKINRGDFMATIDRCALIVSEKNTSPIRMTFGEDRIDCRCVTPVGRAEDVCPCQGSGDGMEIGFNDRYMMDALKAANTDELVLRLNTSSSPSVLEAADGSKSFTYMILPVRLRAGE